MHGPGLPPLVFQDHVEETNKMVAAQSRDKTLQTALWQKENVVRQMKHDVRMWKEDVTQKFAAKLQQELQKYYNHYLRS